MSFIISSYPAPLPTSRTSNQATAVAEVARTLAGRARWLHEMATGQSAETGNATGLLRNPQGLVGVDHSGAPYGVALRHPIVEGGDPYDVNAGTYWTDTGSNVLTTSISSVQGGEVWVKPHVEGVGPYTEGTLEVWAASVGATAAVEITVTDHNGREHTTPVNINSSWTLETGPVVPLGSGANVLRVVIKTTDNPVTIAGWSINQTVQIRDS